VAGVRIVHPLHLIWVVHPNLLTQVTSRVRKNPNDALTLCSRTTFLGDGGGVAGVGVEWGPTMTS
jgi:hypothetical protein